MLKSHWTTWYRHRRWKRIRLRQLHQEPLCRFCKAEGRVTVATIADHVENHFGDPKKFWFGKLQSLCHQCHVSTKKFEEARGYQKTVGVDGIPTDPKHPANQPRSHFQRFGFGIPHNIRPSAIPVALVCGPPAAGKTTWVNFHKK